MNMKFKINKPLKQFKAGEIIELECDDKGIPINLYWFRRHEDSILDNCIQLADED